MVEKIFHKPVLLNKVIELLVVKKGGKYIDATVGGGGYALEIVKRGGKILGIDCDPEAIQAAGENLSLACPPLKQEKFASRVNSSWRLVRGNFREIKKIAQKEGFGRVEGIIFDLGVSWHQLEEGRRGFSFRKEGPLDMRMDPSLKITAGDLVNNLSENELTKIFLKFGEEKRARRIAEAICRARQLKPITTTQELVEIILRALPKGKRKKHPARKCFQALRITVNNELENLKEALPQAEDLLKPGGRLLIISFHSLEDRIVKNFFNEEFKKGKLKILTKKPIRPTEEEKKENPKSRSAKLRVAEKI
ncbi:MAG: 16S rRNA (cytosine(1402)-N(4))-methyltransferase RsmH [Microgenomates group bacterium]